MSVATQTRKTERARRRRLRVRQKIRGTAQRPRLTVNRTLRGMFVQLVDDDAGRTLVGMGLHGKGVESEGDKKQRSHKLGLLLAAKAKESGIETVVFDRNRFPYHGRVKAFAEGARKGGLKF